MDMHLLLPSKIQKIWTLKQMWVLDTGLGIYSVALVLELLVHSLTHSLIHSFIQQVFTVYVYPFAAEDRGPDPPLTQAHAEPAAGEPLRWAPSGSTCSSLCYWTCPTELRSCFHLTCTLGQSSYAHRAESSSALPTRVRHAPGSIPIFQMRKLMPRKVEFLAQEEAVAGPKPRSV